MIATTFTESRVEHLPFQLTTPRLSPKRPKVLIVEDHDDTREMLRVILEMRGCLVMDACNGLEGVELARREQPDMILMDGSLPILDGLAATRRIREDVRLREVFIIALNGWGTRSYYNDAIAAGCNDCMVKPIDFDRLETYLSSLFAHSLPVAA
jgi:two-component system cell cycle response regulator DivK